MTVVPSIRGDCPAVHPKCVCRGGGIKCYDLGNVSQVPTFKHSNTVYNSLVIGGKTTLSTVQTGAFNGLKVRSLTLASIGITAIQSGVFSHLSDTLEQLSLHDNELKTMPGDSFDGLGQLRVLYLGNNYFKTVIPAWFSQLPLLDHLDLSENKLETIPDKSFNKLHKLEVLHLYNNGLETVNTACFSQLTALEELYLYKNQLAFIQNDAFKDLIQLKYLWLNQNRLKTLSSAVVQNKPHLVQLTLNGNPLECDCCLAWVRKMAHILKEHPIALCASPPPVNGTSVVAYDISLCAANETGIFIILIVIVTQYV